MTARFAVYFAPRPDTALWRFGTQWLGRDPISGADLAQPRLAGLDQDRIRKVTESPRHYGFHATLKAPFELAVGTSREELDKSLRGLAAGRRPFELAPLRLAELDGFVALLTSRDEPELQELADDCVRTFDAFRAPPAEHDLARRRVNSLSTRQRRYLEQWGYPYVFDAFRFHMTLSCRLDAPERTGFLERLRQLTEDLGVRAVRLDAVCLFEQPNRSTPFRLTERYAFG